MFQEKKRNDFVSEQNARLWLHPALSLSCIQTISHHQSEQKKHWGNHTTRLHSKQRVFTRFPMVWQNLRFYTSIKLNCKIQLPLCTLAWNTSDWACHPSNSDFAFSKVWYTQIGTHHNKHLLLKLPDQAFQIKIKLIGDHKSYKRHGREFVCVASGPTRTVMALQGRGH